MTEYTSAERRYLLFDVIASGGMASVHFGRVVGPAGFARTVAIKRLHPHLARDPEFAAMFLDEARVAARIHHPNVVATHDVTVVADELLLVMDYVRGETLSRLFAAAREQGETVPAGVLSAIIVGVLDGLHAAHEAKSEKGEPLALVHRDVSPQNILVGADGLARLVDFGVAKSASHAHSTQDGSLKGKIHYMSPEQLSRLPVDRRADVYAIGVILWEAFANERLFKADDALGVLDAVRNEPVRPIDTIAPETAGPLATAIHRALDRDPAKRFATATEMAEAIARALPPAAQRDVAAWVVRMAQATIASRDALLAQIEESSGEAAHRGGNEAVVRLSEQPTLILDVPVTSEWIDAVGAEMATATTRRRIWPAAIGIGLATAVAFLVGREVTRSSPAQVEAAVSALPPAPKTEPSEPPPSPANSAAPAPLATGTPTSIRRAPPAAAKSPRKPKCDPPTFFDSKGIEHIKPECL